MPSDKLRDDLPSYMDSGLAREVTASLIARVRQRVADGRLGRRKPLAKDTGMTLNDLLGERQKDEQ